jgi:hypothetical protein
MQWQGKNIITRLNWGKFGIHDEVYVYFPRTKTGHSPKFTSYWRGPCQVIKMSDVTYVVNCGPRGSNQVIHVDRMRLKHSQLLVGENDIVSQENAVDKDEGSVSLNRDIMTKDSESATESCQDLDKGADLPARQFKSRRPFGWQIMF